ncbi:MAG: glycerophosphodiester phosphodiesterase family protein [Byssovorax sp.]
MREVRGFERLSGRPRVIGHRGVRRSEPPENTMGAFAAAAAEGAEAIELDVRVCRSGELVVFHDPTLERMTEKRDHRAIADLAWEELREVELPPGERVPRLVDVLRWARPLRLPVNVEMKRDVPSRTAVVRATARALASWDPAHPILVSSFDPLMLLGLGLLLPRVPRALLIHPTEWRRTAEVFAGILEVGAVHLEHTLATEARVKALHAVGKRVNVWTVNDPIEAARLASAGVDAIITDAPGALRAALRSPAPR